MHYEILEKIQELPIWFCGLPLEYTQESPRRWVRMLGLSVWFIWAIPAFMLFIGPSIAAALLVIVLETWEG